MCVGGARDAWGGSGKPQSPLLIIGEAVEQHAETAVAEQLAKIQELQAQYDMLQRQLQTTTLQSNALQHTPALDTFWGPPMQVPYWLSRLLSCLCEKPDRAQPLASRSQ